MSLLEVNYIINRLERNLIRDYMISADFNCISNGNVNRKRRLVISLAIVFSIVLLIDSVIGFFADSKSSLHFYSLNAFYGFGYFGRLWNGIYACGWISTITYARILFTNEAKGNLYPVIKLKEMYGKLRYPCAQETASFLYFLKIMLYVREAAFLAVWLPMIVFRGIGAVVTAYKFSSVAFLVAFLPVFIVHMITQPYPCQVRGYTHLFIAQSATYFKLRLARVEKSLDRLLGLDRTKVSQTKLVGTIQSQLVVLQEILNEVRDHNECIKYWLRDELVLTRSYLSFFLIIAVGPIAWYYKVCTAVSIAFWGGMLCPSFTYSALLYLRIRSLAKRLHSCQNHLQVPRKSSSDAAILTENLVSSRDVIKAKQQVMRMIHRVSSHFLRISYTEGDGESFSTTSITQSISTVFLNTLMFLNAKSSTVKHLLKM